MPRETASLLTPPSAIESKAVIIPTTVPVIPSSGAALPMVDNTLKRFSTAAIACSE